MYSVHMHVLTPTQLIAKAEAREKERQKAEERKVQSTFSVLLFLFKCMVYYICVQ